MIPRPPISNLTDPLFPDSTLFRSRLGVAADRIDPGITADRLQLRAHDPVLDRAQIAGLRDLVREDIAFGGQIAAVGLPARLASNLLGALAVGILVANGIHDDFAKPRRHRSDRKSTRLNSSH